MSADSPKFTSPSSVKVGAEPTSLARHLLCRTLKDGGNKFPVNISVMVTSDNPSPQMETLSTETSDPESKLGITYYSLFN